MLTVENMIDTIYYQETELEALKAELKALRASNALLRTWNKQSKAEIKTLRNQLNLYKPMYRDVMATLLGLSSKY